MQAFVVAPAACFLCSPCCVLAQAVARYLAYLHHSRMAYDGYSFHFASNEERDKAKAAADLGELGERKTERDYGIDRRSLQHLHDGFYVRWLRPIKCIGARSWLKRVAAGINLKQDSLKICAHTCDPKPGADYSRIVLLRRQERGAKSKFYRLPEDTPSRASSVVVSAASVSDLPELPARLDAVSAAPACDRDIINSPTSCWSLGLLANCSSLRLRAKRYTIGQFIDKGSFGDVFMAAFGDPGTLQVRVKRIQRDDPDLRVNCVEVNVLEHCNIS